MYTKPFCVCVTTDDLPSAAFAADSRVDNLPSAAFAAEPATRGSTTDARKAMVDMIGLPDCENGIGWYASGPVHTKHNLLIQTC